MIRKGIIALCEEHRELKSQGDIIKALKENGIDNVKQVDVSRALAELQIRQRENHYWVMDYDNSQQDEIEKLSDLFDKSKNFLRILNVDVLVVQTEPYYNTMIAKQIEQTFPNRKISTICPNEVDIIVFYRTRKNDGSLIKEIKAIRDGKKVSKKSRSNKAP